MEMKTVANECGNRRYTISFVVFSMQTAVIIIIIIIIIVTMSLTQVNLLQNLITDGNKSSFFG
jgi:hypothetical protein